MNRGSFTTMLVFYENNKYGKFLFVALSLRFGALKSPIPLHNRSKTRQPLLTRCEDYNLSPSLQRAMIGQGKRQLWIQVSWCQTPAPTRSLACCSPILSKVHGTANKAESVFYFLHGQSGAGGCSEGRGGVTSFGAPPH